MKGKRSVILKPFAQTMLGAILVSAEKVTMAMERTVMVHYSAF